MKFLVPWHSLEDVPAQQAGMERELARELAVGHPLFGLTIRALARHDDGDDVLFSILDGTYRVAVVHLTWISNPPDRPPWPASQFYEDLDVWVRDCMLPEHAEFEAD
jgi:hypothetical protein